MRRNAARLLPKRLLGLSFPFLIFKFHLVLLFANYNSCNAQYLVEPFDPDVNLRQSVCDRQDFYHNRTFSLRDALVGFQLNAMLGVDGRFVKPTDESASSLPTTDAGLIPEMLDQLAFRAKFDWRSSYTLLTTIFIPENSTYLELLQWSVERFDLSAAYWDKTSDASDLGATFPEGWYDSTLIMVGFENDEYSLNVWSFLKPFSREVWICVGIALLLSGIIYKGLDYFDAESNQNRLELNPSDTLYDAALSFTGEIHFDPDTNATRILTFSLAFFCLLVTSAYTANLASFLVVRNTPIIQIQSIRDAVKNDYRICVEQGTPAELDLARSHPELNLVPQMGERAVYEGINDGQCEMGVVAVSSWKEFRQNEDVNGECKMKRIGRAFKTQVGGFATKSDSGTLCTSLVRDVIDLHLVEMKEDGWLDDAWDRHVAKLASVDCDAALDDEQGDDATIQLTLQSMGGLFIVHGMFTGAAILVVVFNNARKHRPCRKQNDSEHVVSGEAPKSVSDGELDVLARCEKMVENQQEKMTTILEMMNDMQKESDEVRLLLNSTSESAGSKSLSATAVTHET